MPDAKKLAPEVLMEKIGNSLKNLDKLTFLESYAMFMGKAQLIEFSLKKILSIKYRYSNSRLEGMTLGGAISELEGQGLRRDFVSLLRELKKFRNDMAHDFLATHVSLVALDHRFGQISWRTLRRAIVKVEETIHVYDFLNQNRHLFRRQRKVY